MAYVALLRYVFCTSTIETFILDHIPELETSLSEPKKSEQKKRGMEHGNVDVDGDVYDKVTEKSKLGCGVWIGRGAQSSQMKQLGH